MNETGTADFLVAAFETYLQNSSDMIFVKDSNLVYVAASLGFARLAGFEKGEDLIGKTDADFFSAELARKYTDDDRTVIKTGVNIENYVEPLPDDGFKKKYSATSKYPIYNSKKEIIGIYGIARDITAQVELKVLHKKVATDTLTGLANREYLFTTISSLLACSDNDRQYALLFIDLDYFKQINDRWGHQFGDTVLQAVAAKLRKIFGEDNILGRLSGDEFLVFLKDVPSREAVESLANETVQTLACRSEQHNMDIEVSCSVGIAFCKSGSVTVENLCAQADSAMYRAKKSGRHQIFFYEDMQ